MNNEIYKEAVDSAIKHQELFIFVLTKHNKLHDHRTKHSVWLNLVGLLETWSLLL